MEVWWRWLQSEKTSTCCPRQLPALQQIKQRRVTYPTRDDTTSSATWRHADAPFLPGGVPASEYRNRATVRAPAIRPTAPWSSESHADAWRNRYKMLCVSRPPALLLRRSCQRPSPATVREFDCNSYCVLYFPETNSFSCSRNGSEARNSNDLVADSLSFSTPAISR